MRIAEQVTFGGGGQLDRMAHLRKDADAVAAEAAHPDARYVVLWRGKVLAHQAGEDEALTLLPAGHPVLASASGEAIFLGREDGFPRFGSDISGWEPAELPDSVGGFIDTSEQMHPDIESRHRFVDLRQCMSRLSPADAELAASAKALFGWHDIHGFCANCGARTEIAAAGWQRNCPECGRMHFPRTDPVVIMLVTHGQNLLVGRSHFWPEKSYSVLAGFVEPGETLEAAVRREVFEEAGIPIDTVTYLASQPWPFPASLMVGCHAHATASEITLDPEELEDATWVSRSELSEIFAGNSERIKLPRAGSIARFVMENWLADRLD